MPRFHHILGLVGLLTALVTAPAQSTRVWTSDSDQRWSRNNNWSGSKPDKDSEIAGFGTGSQLNPELNSNSYTVLGISFSVGAGGYNVGDDNGSRTLGIGKNSDGFIENLSVNDQLISIATLEFKGDSTITNAGAGRLTIGSELTGNNRDLRVDGSGDTHLTGDINTGGGGLTKDGAGTLHLSGSNTNTGGTTINAGSLVLDSSHVLADTGNLTVNTGGTFSLNGQSEYIARLSGSGTVDLGGGQLTLGSGFSYFSGDFTGSGELVVGSGALLYLGADFNNSNLNITLAGGSLYLGGHSLTAGALHITADSFIDFSAWSDAALTVDTVGFGGTGITLDVRNWTDAADYFFSQTPYNQGSAPLDQIVFQGWTGDDTKWQSYDSQITPVPEPSAYGALLVAGALVFAGLRARRKPGGAVMSRKNSPHRFA